MFAVIRHTYKLDIPDPSNPNSNKSSAKWEHLVWIFETELEALAFAITLLDDPLITSNRWLIKSAIHQLENDRFYQVGRESVAIAEIQDAPEIIYTNNGIQEALEELITEELKDEKPIH
jgi:hypothetical protein|tara:strand:- start:178 stop:534 length:357 start_codon:yes stop_codon:yes gene_type:complete